MKNPLLLICLAALCCTTVFAQEDRTEVRSGNRKFKAGDFKKSEIQYRKALVKDSTSFAASYDLASSLYMQKDYDGAAKAFAGIEEAAPESGHASDWSYNLGCNSLQQKDWDAAIKAFRQTLLEHPEDMDAKENYIYAKMMKKNEENQQNQNQDKNQDQDQNQNQQNQQNQDQNQDQNQQDQNQNQDKQDQNQQEDRSGQQKIDRQQAQQMLKAIQAKEKETQDKVEKAKAARLQSRQKEKNW